MLQEEHVALSDHLREAAVDWKSTPSMRTLKWQYCLFTKQPASSQNSYALADKYRPFFIRRVIEDGQCKFSGNDNDALIHF